LGSDPRIETDDEAHSETAAHVVERLANYPKDFMPAAYGMTSVITGIREASGEVAGTTCARRRLVGGRTTKREL
jgi:hypothetical protein